MTRPRFDRFLMAMLAVILAAGGCDSQSSSSGGSDTSTGGDGAAARAAELLTDVTAAAGIDFVHDRHDTGEFRFPEINGAGVCTLDYDNDGWYDLYFVQGGRLPGVDGGRELSDQLYRNRGDGTFENVTDQARIHATGFGTGCVAGDYNNDGHVDLFVYNTGPNTMLRNNGDGTFADVTAALQLGDPRWAGGGAFVDYDADGHLDLMLSNYAVWDPQREKECTIRDTGARDYCGPATHTGDRDVLYHNNRDGTFTDVSTAAGVVDDDRTGMGIACADFTGDGLQDIYVANDARRNNLWVQSRDHTFTDEALQWMCDLNEEGKPQSSMGVLVEDFDLNGHWDLLLTHFWDEYNTLYLNSGTVFRDASQTARLKTCTLPYTGFGVSALDLHNDGGMQIYIANGKANMASKVIYIEGNAYAEKQQLLDWSYQTKQFTDITDTAGGVFKTARVGRGTALIDYDNDGDMDLAVSTNNGPAMLLRNNAPKSNHWLEVRCIGPDGKRDAYGAEVEIRAGDMVRRKLLYVASSYAGSSDPRLHFGLGQATRVDTVTVKWIDGRTSTWKDVPADQLAILRYDER